jgi:hypothetical protein
MIVKIPLSIEAEESKEATERLVNGFGYYALV